MEGEIVMIAYDGSMVKDHSKITFDVIYYDFEYDYTDGSNRLTWYCKLPETDSTLRIYDTFQNEYIENEKILMDMIESIVETKRAREKNLETSEERILFRQQLERFFRTYPDELIKYYDLNFGNVFVPEKYIHKFDNINNVDELKERIKNIKFVDIDELDKYRNHTHEVEICDRYNFFKYLDNKVPIAVHDEIFDNWEHLENSEYVNFTTNEYGEIVQISIAW